MLGRISRSAAIMGGGLLLGATAAPQPGREMTPTPGQIRTILAHCASERAAVIASRSEAATNYIEGGVRHAKASLDAEWLATAERNLQWKRREIAAGSVDAKFVGYDVCLQSRWLQFVREALPQPAIPQSPPQPLQNGIGIPVEGPQGRPRVAQNELGGDVNDDSNCIDLDRTQSGSVQLVNKCGYPLRIRACVVYDQDYAKSRSFDCLSRRSDGSWDLPRYSRTAALLGGGTAYWVICRPPAIPANVVFEQGRGLLGQCR